MNDVALGDYLRTLAAAERQAMPGSSRAEKVGHKAAAEAYEIALAALAEVEAPTHTDDQPGATMTDTFPPATLEEDLRVLLNQHSVENVSETPDFILASYLLTCLDAFDAATLARDIWHGRFDEDEEPHDPQPL